MLNRLSRWCLEWRITADEASTRCVRAAWAPSGPLTPTQPLVLSGLEPRILFSATPIDMAALMGGDDSGAMVATVETSEESGQSSESEITASTLAEQSSSEIIIIDASVPDLQQLLDDLSASGRDAAVFVLDAERDGVDQITEILADRSDLDSIHLVTHSENGAIKLGNLWLGEANLDGYAGQLASWQSSLTADADILLYGCDLAADTSGRALVESISALTGADVAASSDDTGHERYGGDWDLEYTTGEIESDVAFSDQLQQDWQYKLATITVTTFADVVDNGDAVLSLREAVIQANAGGGGDTILLSSGIYTLTIGGVGENAAATGDLDITQSVTITGAGSSTIINANGLGDRVFHIQSGTTTISDLKVTGGTEDLGGAIKIDSATLNLTDVEVYGNHATSNGGGLYSIGTINLNRVTIAENTADGNGGGMYMFAGNVATLTNVTISGNDAFRGGGLMNWNADLTLVNCTVADNTNGIATQGGHVTRLKNTILDNVGINSEAALTSLGNNIDSDGTAGLGDALDGFDPLLGLLADNGGQVRTHAITVASPAYNAGTPAGAPVIDGRGRGRDGSPDIGAYEFATGSVLTVDTTNDVADGDTSSIAALLASRGADGYISFREAIAAANNTANGGTPDEILFDIADNDPGHVYYRNDLTGGTLSTIATTTLDDGSIGDFDPDHPYGQHSWFRIDLNNALPQLEITDAVIINGYSQSGASQNTLTVGNNAKLRIELTNSAADVNRGLTIQAGGAGSSISGLVINSFGSAGILTETDANNVTIQGNFLGTDVTGTVDLGNGDAGVHLRSNDNQVGGSSVANRNVISGNEARGVTTYSFGPIKTGNVIENNYIGVDATGVRALGNSGEAGVQLLNNSGARVLNNVIAANAGDGIWIRPGGGASNNVIQGNLIGVGADGTTALGHAGNGIRVDEASINTTIGGIAPGQGNVIANNAGDGVHASNGSGTAIRGNRIFNNGGLGIDLLGVDGVDPNDVNNDDLDSGPNGLQNYPILLSAIFSGGNLSITGTLDSTPGTTFDFDFYASATLDGSGHGEAERYLGSATGLSTDVNGDLSFNSILNSVTVAAGEFITATATDANGNTSEFAFSVVVNQPPTANAGGPYAIDEAGSLDLDGTLSSDPDGDTLTFAWDLDNDGIFGEAGEPITATATVSWATLQSFGILNDGAYTIGLQVDDGKGGIATTTATVTVNNLDPMGNADGGAGFTTDEDTSFTTANVLANDSDPNSLDVLFVSGLDLAGTTGLVIDNGDGTFDYDPNGQFESLGVGQQTTDTFTYFVSDGDGGSSSVVVTITINGRNDMATDIALDNAGVNENAVGAVIGNVGVVDVDAGDTHTWTVDDVRFEVVGGQLRLRAGQSLDFETEPTVNLTITATDQGGGGLTYNEAFVITVNNLNEAPTDITLSSNTVPEQTDGAIVGNVGVVDPDAGDTHTWTVDDVRFEVVGGQLKLRAGQTLNVIAEPTVNLTITVTDQGGAGLSYNEVFVITVTNVNQAPTDISLSNTNVPEQTDGAIVGNVGVTDPDAGDTHTWIVDDVRFEVVGGQLKLRAGQTLDFIAEPTVSLTITVTDQGGAGLSYNEVFVITVTNVNQAPTDISLDNTNVAENAAGAVIGNVGVVDPDAGDTHTWTVDDVRFEIVGGQLRLRAGQSLDFETEPTVNLTITATDQGGAGLAYNEAFVITVNNGNEAPTDVTLSGTNVNENTAGAAIGNIGIVDPDTFDFHTATVNDARFEIFGSQLRLRAGQSLNFESQPTVDVTITVRDQGGTGLAYSEVFTITVNNLNDAPTADTEGYFVIEGTTVVSSAPGVLLGDLDPDGDAITALLQSGPSFGTLVLAADGSFTYTPDAGFTGIDAFVYIASDGSLSSAPTLVTISVTAGVAPLPPTPGDKDGDDDDPVPPIPPVSDPDPGEEPQTPIVNEVGPVVPGSDTPNSAPTPRERLVPVLPGEPTGNEVFIADRGVDTDGAASFSATLGNSIESNGKSLTAEEIRSRLQAIFQVSVFDSQWQSLDTLREELLHEGKYESLVVGAAVGAAVAMSVGQAVWLLRAGYMASTLMSTMPIWRSIDPLPVLEYLEGDSDRPADTESLQSIIQQGNSEQPV